MVHNLATSVNELKSQLLEETNTTKESIQSHNGCSGIQVHVPKKFPHNPEPINAADTETIMNEKSGASCVFPLTDTDDFIPFRPRLGG